MLEIASQILLYLIFAALIGMVIGYFLGKASCPKSKYKEETPKIEHTKKKDSKIEEKDAEVEESKPPMLLKKAREEGKDNLQLIKGIGKVIEKTLNEKGIYHFDQIASWSKEEVKWIDKAISFPGRAERENWIEQAKLLAQGEETEFSKRVNQGKVSSSKKS